MRTWTIQKRTVLNIIDTEGYYIPDFGRRDLSNKSLSRAYAFLLDVFNNAYRPKKKIEGVVFCMAPSFERVFESPENIEKHFMRNPGGLNYLLNEGESLLDGDNVLLELDYPDNFLFLDVDVELFCALDDCLYYDENAGRWGLRLGTIMGREYLKRMGKLTRDWMLNESKEFLFSSPCNLVQQHIPFIEKENIVHCWPISVLGGSEKYIRHS